MALLTAIRRPNLLCFHAINDVSKQRSFSLISSDPSATYRSELGAQERARTVGRMGGRCL